MEELDWTYDDKENHLRRSDTGEDNGRCTAHRAEERGVDRTLIGYGGHLGEGD